MIERMKAKQPKPVKIKPCKLCTGYGHTPWQCRKNPKKPMQAKKQLKARKPMNKVGKISKKLATQSAKFHKEHPGPQDCVYCEFMGVDPMVTDWNTEHTNSRARHPEDRFNYEKLVVGCPYHNKDKGSMDYDQYMEKLRKQKEEANTWPT